MKILFDYQIFGHQRVGGISRYFSALLQGLGRIKGVNTTLSLAYHRNQYLKGFDLPGPGWRMRLARRIMGQSRAACNRQLSLCYLEQGEYDVFHPTNYDPYFLDALGSKPMVLTVHDMAHERFQGQYLLDDHEQIIRNKRLLIERADAIIAVSRSTAQDLLHFHPRARDKVKVIHHGGTLFTQGEKLGGALNGLPDQFLLFVGNRHHYKNFLGFIQAMAPILRAQRDLYVICAGARDFCDLESATLLELGIHKQCRWVPAVDRDLGKLYTCALMLVYPSLYEGFGLPVLEAFAHGCPVAVGRVGALPEVAGKAAVFFDPTCRVSMQQTIEKVIGDIFLRGEMQKNGYLRLKLFSWQRTVEETTHIYRQILK
ncbi:glycosyltransferase family 4 protein [Planctomycetota bacterium]